MQKNDDWGDLEQFSSKSAFGGIVSSEIKKISQQADQDGKAVVYAEVFYSDATNGDETFKENFYLKQFGGEWKIVDMKLATGNETNNSNNQDNTSKETVNWDGTWTYEEYSGETAGGTPIWADYKLVIKGETCTIEGNGYQLGCYVDCYVDCYGKNKGSEYEIYFKKYNDDNITCSNYKKDEHLLTLKKENGKIITYDKKLIYEDEAKVRFEKEMNKNEAVEDIRAKFKTINGESSSYRTVPGSIELGEGVRITGFYNGNDLKKILSETALGYGYCNSEYYFWNDNLFFVYEKCEYDDPDDPTSEKKQVVEERIYFYKGKIIKWLDNDKKEVSSSKFSDKEDEIRKTVQMLRENL